MCVGQIHVMKDDEQSAKYHLPSMASRRIRQSGRADWLNGNQALAWSESRLSLQDNTTCQNPLYSGGSSIPHAQRRNPKVENPRRRSKAYIPFLSLQSRNCVEP